MTLTSLTFFDLDFDLDYEVAEPFVVDHVVELLRVREQEDGAQEQVHDEEYGYGGEEEQEVENEQQRPVAFAAAFFRIATEARGDEIDADFAQVPPHENVRGEKGDDTDDEGVWAVSCTHHCGVQRKVEDDEQPGERILVAVYEDHQTGMVALENSPSGKKLLVTVCITKWGTYCAWLTVTSSFTPNCARTRR